MLDMIFEKLQDGCSDGRADIFSAYHRLRESMPKRSQSSSLRSYRSRPQPYHKLAPGEEPNSARVTLDLNSEIIANLDALKKSFGDVTNTEVIRRSHFDLRKKYWETQ